MPEEKVKQYECLCPCEHETGCIACENGNHDYHIVPPAADAGPRQPKLCPTCLRGEETRFPTATCLDKWHNAPPVSQEAAPGLTMPPSLTSVLDKLAAIESKTTAPDSAMRVAEQITQSGYLRTADIAALIREAGSDELTKLRADRAREHQWLNLAATEANCDLDSVASAIRKLRQAGSERERRLMSVLFVIMSDMPKKRDWLDPDIEREASRLLGGES